MIRRIHFKACDFPSPCREGFQIVRVSLEIGKTQALKDAESGDEAVKSAVAQLTDEGLDFIYGEITQRLERMRMHVHFASGIGANVGRIDSLFDELIAFIGDTGLAY